MPAINSVKQNTPFNLPGFLKRSSLLIGSSILRLATQLIIIFIFSRNLSINDYGLYQSAWLYVNIISIVGLFGLPSLILSSSVNAIRCWINQYKTKFLTLSLVLNCIPFIYVLFAVNEYNITIKLLLLTVSIIQNISILAETVAIKNKKEKLVFDANFIFSAGYLICHLIILYTGYSLPILLACIIALLITKTLFLFFSGYRIIDDSHIHDITAKSTGKQWLYLGLNDIAGMLFKWLDKWIILSFISLTQFAIYFNGSYEIPVFVISIFVLPLRITNFTAVLQVNKRTDLVLKGALLDLLVAIIFMTALYPLLQLKGLALAFVLSTYVQAGYYLWHTGKLINKKISYFFPFKKLLLLMVLSIVITRLFLYLFTAVTNSQNMMPGIAVCIILIIALLIFHFKAGKKNISY